MKTIKPKDQFDIIKILLNTPGGVEIIEQMAERYMATVERICGKPHSTLLPDNVIIFPKGRVCDAN